MHRIMRHFLRREKPLTNLRCTNYNFSYCCTIFYCRTSLPNELQNPAMERQTSNSMQSAENQIAHNQQEEASLDTTLGEESNAAIGGMNKAISDEKGETLFHLHSLPRY